MDLEDRHAYEMLFHLQLSKAFAFNESFNAMLVTLNISSKENKFKNNGYKFESNNYYDLGA